LLDHGHAFNYAAGTVMFRGAIVEATRITFFLLTMMGAGFIVRL
jgi:hypothetical protein